MNKYSQRTLAYYKEQGLHPWRVEQWNQHTMRRTDLYNLFDYEVIGNRRNVGVQSTGANGRGKHRADMLANKYLPIWLETGSFAELVTWRKGSNGRYLMCLEEFYLNDRGLVEVRVNIKE